MTSVYLASKFGRREELLGYAGELREAGVTVTSRWLTQHGKDSVTVETTGNTELGATAPRFASEDVEDVAAADTLISFTAGGGGRGGRHVDFGVGVALGKRLILVGPRENVFHALVEVEQYDTWEEVKTLITGGK